LGLPKLKIAKYLAKEGRKVLVRDDIHLVNEVMEN